MTNLINAVSEAITAILNWIAMTFKGFWEWLNISEWSVLGIGLAIAIMLISIFRNKK